MQNDEIIEIIVREVRPLYIKVKKILALSEQLSNTVDIGSINEARNALDHLMRVFSHSQDDIIIKELNECKEHLIRGAFDAMDTLCLEYLEKSEDILKTFDIELIVRVEPKIIREYIPNIKRLMEECSNIKAHKYEKIDHSGASLLEDNSRRIDIIFKNYEEVFYKIYTQHNDILACIEHLVLAKEQDEVKIKKEFLRRIKLGIIVFIITSSLTYFATSYFSKKSDDINNTEKTTE